MIRSIPEVDDLITLSRLFSYPEEPFEAKRLEKLRDCGWEGKGAGMSERQWRKIQNEYVRLFINALPEVSCPPYGAFYIEGTLLGPSTLRVRRLYRAYGFETEEMPDHLAVELEFLAVLGRLSEEFPVGEDYTELLQHVRRWTPEFFSRVEQNDGTGFYRAVCRYAMAVLLPAEIVPHNGPRPIRVGPT